MVLELTPVYLTSYQTGGPAGEVLSSLVFTSVSNVLKTRHDTAKNSLGN
jgi:hypothetical protein